MSLLIEHFEIQQPSPEVFFMPFRVLILKSQVISQGMDLPEFTEPLPYINLDNQVVSNSMLLKIARATLIAYSLFHMLSNFFIQTPGNGILGYASKNCFIPLEPKTHMPDPIAWWYRGHGHKHMSTEDNSYILIHFLLTRWKIYSMALTWTTLVDANF